MPLFWRSSDDAGASANRDDPIPHLATILAATFVQMENSLQTETSAVYCTALMLTRGHAPRVRES